MKILHTEASKGWGGQEIRILDESEGMIARGHDVQLATPAEATISGEAKRRAIPVRAIALDRRRPKALRALRAFIREFTPDVIVSHSSTDSWLVALATRFLNPKPAIVRLRHLSGPVSRGQLNRWLYGQVPARVVTTGVMISQMLIERLSLDPARVVAIPTGTDLARFRPGDQAAARKKLKLPSGNVVGVVATLRSWKGHRFLVEAMNAPRLADARLILIGDGPQEEALRAQINRLGLAERVTLAGRQDDVVPWLHALDVFALPSTGSEGVPQALMQAMACGLPVVTTAAGAIPELVRGGENGLVVPMQNSTALADAIARLLDDKTLAKRLAAAGRREVEQHHTKAAMLDAMEAVFRAAIKESRG